MAEKERKDKMRTIQGRVVSDRHDKTRVILVETLIGHPLLKKAMRRSHRIKIHDENNASKEGDLVIAVESNRPLSRHKRHRLLKILEHAS